MGYARSSLLLLLLVTADVTNATDYYKIQNVKRLDQDLYRAGNVYIETRYCYHYASGYENAVVKWEGQGKYSGNKIIWEDDTFCDINNIFTK